MIKALLNLFLFLAFSVTAGYAQADYKNPFESRLPQEAVEAKAIESSQEERDSVVALPEGIAIEGVLWGSKMPQAIINGEVYKKGEKLESDKSVSIFNIKDNTVFFLYQGKIFKKKPIKKTEQGRR
ncbi:MAG: hypothetical protein K9L77_02730 [Candidatus Omnitrophica bacterium]|nr:hypothetical protein [Candidatus Omnitrophota bacterium]MCF7876937.1 hypothetical protein [Candidatus Omnitrophota bacterium]MCF7893062.1 hypothetical protein [Candidatus Omnitrophota bacterium]